MRRSRPALVETPLHFAGIDMPGIERFIDASGDGRRRATLHARKEGSGYMRLRSHQVHDLDACPILVPGLARAPDIARAVMLAIGEADIGFTATLTGLDVAVRTEKKQARADRLMPLVARFKLARLALNGEMVLQAQPPIIEMGRARVELPIGSFLQATAAAETILADYVAEAVGKAKAMADLFCGVGPFALRLAETRPVYAADNDKAGILALDKARRFTKGLREITAKPRDLFREPLTRYELDGFEAVVLDPPRAGAQAQAEQLSMSKVKTIVMVACDAKTFARDAAILIGGGYAHGAISWRSTSSSTPPISRSLQRSGAEHSLSQQRNRCGRERVCSQSTTKSGCVGRALSGEEHPMHILTNHFAIGLLCVATAMPSYAQDAPAAEAASRCQAVDPSGSFVDEFGTSFEFSLCGDSGTDLCGVLTTLKGESATEENLAFVGKQVMQAKQIRAQPVEGLAGGRGDQCRGHRHPDRSRHHRNPGLPRGGPVPDAGLQPLRRLLTSFPSQGSWSHLADGGDALFDDGEDFVAGPFPPVVLGKDFDFLRAVIACAFNHCANGRQVDDAIAHHAAIEQHVLGGDQPVADVVGEDAVQAAGAGDGGGEVWVPPDVIDVDGDADIGAKLFADIERLIDRVHAGAVGGIHGVQRLDGDLDPRGQGMRQHGGDAVGDHLAGAAVSPWKSRAIRRRPAPGNRR